MTMHLVQILLPLNDNDGQPLERALFARVREEMVQRFGGLTAYTRAPAKGLWKEEDGVQLDEIVVYEVMDPGLDRAWWASYRRELEQRFAQEQLVIRASVLEML